MAPGVAGVPGFTLMVTASSAVAGEAHVAFDVKVTFTCCPSVIVEELKFAPVPAAGPVDIPLIGWRTASVYRISRKTNICTRANSCSR